ncbi:uncharacterized protein N7483_005604 [Penicillium malachiteum]|uniref:uncharacterized protein n=1 Tax=Penicillium malachiteum TaxID=1324776 RepID=UPI00254993C4|nr:uncharacterized protein N7483_005604 [Penicillium malachiteum]KAJ5731096.1 hypothetical protein N7483_005604 [Penicillium malachiteum]
MLTPGVNKIKLDLHRYGSVQVEDSLKITVNYVPLLQLPPLHLAILVAKDSPLLIDCPPAKYGGISTAHSSLDAAISKFRMTAYMWQALTAEYFRGKKTGRRSFRFDEEWTVNITTQIAHQAGPDHSAAMGMVAKVHIIRCEKSVAEIRDMSFEATLLKSGAPFEPRSRPVVAGLIFDAHYSADQSIILGHAALGCHKPNGISLGIFGSHLTYSWPRFLQEVPACLTDETSTGNILGNKNGECDSMWDTCAFSQCTFLHQVGHAFGARHTTRIMAKDHYSWTWYWTANFIENNFNADMGLDEKWDLRDAFWFRSLPQFALPGDLPMTEDFKNAAVKIEIIAQEKLSIADVQIRNGEKDISDVWPEDDGDMTSRKGILCIHFDHEFIDPNKPLKITAAGMNGKEETVMDGWALLKKNSYIWIFGSKVKLRKRSVQFEGLGENDIEGYVVDWAMLLRHRGKNGQIYRALCIDLQVGDTMNGIAVHYADGHYENYSPKDTRQPHTFGHASLHHGYLPGDENIIKVLIRKHDSGSLAGIRVILSNGVHWGCLNKNGDHNSDGNSETETAERHEEQDKQGKSVFTLEPTEDEVIVGFYGQSDAKSGFIHQFGILTAPKDVELPERVYYLPEFNNTKS